MLIDIFIRKWHSTHRSNDECAASKRYAVEGFRGTIYV